MSLRPTKGTAQIEEIKENNYNKTNKTQLVYDPSRGLCGLCVARECVVNCAERVGASGDKTHRRNRPGCLW